MSTTVLYSKFSFFKTSCLTNTITVLPCAPPNLLPIFNVELIKLRIDISTGLFWISRITNWARACLMGKCFSFFFLESLLFVCITRCWSVMWTSAHTRLTDTVIVHRHRSRSLYCVTIEVTGYIWTNSPRAPSVGSIRCTQPPLEQGRVLNTEKKS